MTIRSKLNLSLLGALAITLAISAWIALELIRVEKVVRDNLRVNALNKQVILLNSLTYDYLNAPSRRADIQWHTAYKLLQARLNELRESADHLTRVPAHVADNYSDIDEAFDQIAARQNDPTGAAPPAGLESSLSSLLLKKNQELYDWVLSASDASNKRLLVVMRRDSVLFVALLFVIALGVSTTLWLLKRGLLPSITRLRSGVETIRQGNLNHRIVPVGRDEFGELSSAFNTMAAELQSAQPYPCS